MVYSTWLSANEPWLVQFFNMGRQFREVGGPPASSCIQLRLVELDSHVDTVRLRALQLCHHKDHLPRGRERERGGETEKEGERGRVVKVVTISLNETCRSL